MCSRFYVDQEMAEAVWKLVKAIDKSRMDSRGRDVYPSQKALVLTSGQGEMRAKEMRWGFPQSGRSQLFINARAETVQEKPSFRESVLYRRCVIPAGGFYEWNAAKEKAAFCKSGVPALYMAGCYQQFEDGDRFVILTTKANASVIPVHDRMPLVLEDNELPEWLSRTERLDEFLQKTPLPLQRQQEYEQQTLPFL